MKVENKNSQINIDSLLTLIETLRMKCPWDRKQTPETLIIYLIEEVYELLDAVTSGDVDHIREEMGDVLFQIMFLIFLYQEKKQFGLTDVIDRNMKKMIRRHPHVFGEEKADTTEKVLENWEIIKSTEKGKTSASLIDTVPSGLPSLHRAYMISEKVGKAGFDWNDIDGVSEKVKEEWEELHDAINKGDHNHVSMEFGDLLFTLTNIARFAGVHPETALSGSVKKFEMRYKYMEQILKSQGEKLADLSDEEKNKLWDLAKKDTNQ